MFLCFQLSCTPHLINEASHACAYTVCATLPTAECLSPQALFGIDGLLAFSVQHCFKRALSKTLCLQMYGSVTVLVLYCVPSRSGTGWILKIINRLHSGSNHKLMLLIRRAYSHNCSQEWHI